ncbi:exported hypothetical protein [Verrucomicrobia bacterium]|nr:exported hypothetical protein [Verrucomicrobiota bacterium]
MRVRTSDIVLACLILCFGCRPKQSDRYAQSPEFGTCINGLRMIDSAKQMWALEHHPISSNVVPTWEDIGPYVRLPAPKDLKWLHCPSGGTYTIGRVADLPTCSYGGPGHTLSP